MPVVQKSAEEVKRLQLEKMLSDIQIQLEETKVKIADGGGWDLSDIQDVLQAVIVVVFAVERQADQFKNLTSREKKMLAVNTLNWLIDLPKLPEWAEEKVFGFAIDAIVTALNTWLSRRWGSLV